MAKTIDANEIIMENLDTVEDIVVLEPEKTGVDFGKIGLAVLGAGAVVALGYKIYKLIEKKKAQKAQEANDCSTIEDDDFEYENESEDSAE